MRSESAVNEYFLKIRLHFTEWVKNQKALWNREIMQ